MNWRKHTPLAIISSFALCAALVIAVPQATEAMNSVTQKFFVKNIVLKGKTASIKQQGSKPVRIQDKLRVDKKLDVRGNIKVKEGKTVDGYDVSALGQSVEGLEANDVFPTVCDTNEVLKYTGTVWECADDVDTNTDTDTTYTAGTGIAINGTTITNTVTDTDTTYTAGDGLNLSGTEFSVAGTSYEDVIIVAESGGDYTTIQGALDSITDAASNNEYLVWVAPGVYNEIITLPDYVHLKGASKNSVHIWSSATGSTTGVINAGAATEVHDVSIYASGPSTSLGVYIGSGDSLELHNVYTSLADPIGFAFSVFNQGWVEIYNSDLNTGDSPSTGIGVYSDSSFAMSNTEVSVQNSVTSQAVGISSTGASYTIDDSTLIVLGTGAAVNCDGIEHDGTSPEGTITNTTVDVEGCSTTGDGIDVKAGTVNIHGSQITSDDDALNQTGGTLNVGASMIDGTVTGTVTCSQAYDGSFSNLNTSCG